MRPRPTAPHKTICNHFIRWSRMGVLNRIFAELAGKAGKPDRIMIDATHLTDRLDPIESAIIIDKRDHRLNGRPSST